MGVGLPLVRLGWRPPGLLLPLPPFFPLLHKTQNPGCPGQTAVKWLLLLLGRKTLLRSVQFTEPYWVIASGALA